MTARQLKHGLFLGFLMLINSIFWGTAIAGDAMPVASYSLTQAAEGRELYAEHCAVSYTHLTLPTICSV